VTIIEISAGDRGKQASVDGFAHEHIAAGILMKRYQNVSLVDLPLLTYDMIIVFKDKAGHEEIIRAQTKTARKSISFTGGTRGGVDRTYKSGVKTYVQSPVTSDVIVGIRPVGHDRFELYFVPTLLIAVWQTKSKSIGQLGKLKENYEFLEHCKDQEFILNKAHELGLIKLKSE
jgi:hypothetical protein